MSNFIKKYKAYIVILLLIIVYSVISLTFFNKEKTENEKYATIIVDGKNIWKYENKEWSRPLETELKEDEDLYKIYSSKSYIGEYTVKVTDSKLYAFDSQYNSLQYDSPIIAVKSNYNIPVMPIEYDTITDQDNSILSNAVNKFSSYKNQVKKITVDIDNDSSNEYLYIIDYYNNNEKIFSEIYLYREILIPIIESTGAYYNYYDVPYILDINNDNKHELIVSSNYYNNISYKIYKIEKNQAELVLE